MAKYIQGEFKPLNPKKYAGNVKNIIYRSSWELACMSYFDKHPDIIQWASEELNIAYVCPVSRKWRKYYPNFVLKQREKNNKIKVVMIEVKPYKETQPPKTKKKTKKLLYETATYAKNQAKWKFAEEYCKKRGWEFRIITEKDLKNGF